MALVGRRAGRDAAGRRAARAGGPGGLGPAVGAGPAPGGPVPPGQPLADTVGALRAAGVTGRFNFLLTDGQLIAATAAGDTLWYRHSGPALVVGSEPGD